MHLVRRCGAHDFEAAASSNLRRCERFFFPLPLCRSSGRDRCRSRRRCQRKERGSDFRTMAAAASDFDRPPISRSLPLEMDDVDVGTAPRIALTSARRSAGWADSSQWRQAAGSCRWHGCRPCSGRPSPVRLHDFRAPVRRAACRRCAGCDQVVTRAHSAQERTHRELCDGDQSAWRRAPRRYRARRTPPVHHRPGGIRGFCRVSLRSAGEPARFCDKSRKPRVNHPSIFDPTLSLSGPPLRGRA